MTNPQPISDLLVNQSLLAFLDAAVDATVIINDDGTIRWASPSTGPLLRRPTADLPGVNALDLVADADSETAALEMLDLLSGNDKDEPPSLFRLHRGDGTTVPVEIKAADLRDDPQIDGVVLTARDVSHRHELEAALLASERRFEAVVRHSSDAIALISREGRIDYVSPSILRLSGFTPTELVGMAAKYVVLNPARDAFAAAFDRVAAEPGATESVRLRIPHKDGGSWWAEVHVVNRFDDPTIGALITNLHDVTAVVEAEARAAQLTEIFDLTDDLVCVVDDQARLQYMNPAFRRFVGMSDADAEDAMGTLWTGLGLLADQAPLEFTGDRGRMWVSDVQLRRHDGVDIPFRLQAIAHLDDSGTVQRYSAVAHDISESRRLARSLEQQAMHDPLTGLPNRKLLERRMQELRDAGTEMAVLFIDLDNFKVINDSLGHAFGDRVLDAVASRLRNVVRSVDVVTRFGGDEFVVLCEGVVGISGARDIAHRVVAAVVQPLVIDGTPVHIGASIGIAEDLDPTTRTDPSELIRDADTAMYQAKASGRGRVVTFDEDLRRRAVERQRIETALRRAPQDGSLVLHYQPVVNALSGRLEYIEALLRWWNGDTLVNPAQFVPIAEETDLIVQLGAWVLEAAAADLARWQRIPGWQNLGLSVNVSVRQLQRPEFGGFVMAVLNRHDLDPSTVAVEITESVMLDDATMNASSIAQLHSAGVQLAIDDFGTGYSSLTYMAKLPVDIVKLDRTFLTAAGATVTGPGSIDERSDDLVAAVLDLVAALGLYCVAEGVETPEQLSQLAALGCDAVQGYLIDRPMAAEVLEARLLDVSPTESWSPHVGPVLRGDTRHPSQSGGS